MKQTHATEWLSTTDVVEGDYVRFKKAIFEGSYPNSTFTGYEEVEGTVIKESYGIKSGQHTFTIQRPDGSKFRIKGRNLYRNECKRLRWINEEKRDKITKEKHERGAFIKERRSLHKYGKGRTYRIAGSSGWYYPVCKICGMHDETAASSERELVPPPSCNCSQ